MSTSTVAPPRDNLFRASRPGLEMRAAEDGGMPTLYGHFIRWNEWTEIDDLFEGRFMERFAPGAFKKTIAERGDQIKVLFQHGHDPLVGDKPLGSIDTLEEDDVGTRYEVPLLDTQYVREIVPGLEAGVYGASFRFSVVQQEENHEPERSEDNPDGIPEHTVKEAKLSEFSPVTFPAYAGATAGVRSLSQHFNIFEQLGRDPERARELLGGHLLRAETQETALEEGEEAGPHSHPASRDSIRRKRIPLVRKEEPWRLP